PRPASATLFPYTTLFRSPEAVMLWQRDLCESLGLKGRILISEHGINGTVGGDMEACKKYVRKTKEYPGFHVSSHGAVNTVLGDRSEEHTSELQSRFDLVC